MPESEPRRPTRRSVLTGAGPTHRRRGGRHRGRRLRPAAAPPVGVDRHPAQGTAVEFRGRITQSGSTGQDFAAPGILTAAAGPDVPDLFEGRRRPIATALFTLTASGVPRVRVLDQSVHALDIAGTAVGLPAAARRRRLRPARVVHRGHRGRPVRPRPAGRAHGFRPRPGLPTLSGDMRQTKAAGLGGRLSGKRFGVNRAAAAHAGDRHRATRRSGDAQRRAGGRRQLVAGVAVRCRTRNPVAVVGAGVKAPGGTDPGRAVGLALRRCARPPSRSSTTALPADVRGRGRPGDRLGRRRLPASDPGAPIRPVPPPGRRGRRRTRSAAVAGPLAARRNAARSCAAWAWAPTRYLETQYQDLLQTRPARCEPADRSGGHAQQSRGAVVATSRPARDRR